MKRLKAKLEKKLEKIERSKYKNKEKEQLRKAILLIELDGFSQNITRFRKRGGL